MTFLQKLQSLFRYRSNQAPEEPTINEILQKGFFRLRRIDPETPQQWLRLQRAMVEKRAEAFPKSRFIPRLAFAIVAAAIAMGGIYLYFTSLQPSHEAFATGRGQQKEIVLHDGSQVTLNYATELVVSKQRAGEVRRVTLAGEAYFRVERNDARFIVTTKFADVEVVGTEFNLRAREGALEVAVISGTVKVLVAKAGSGNSLVLSKYQMALCPQGEYPSRLGDVPSAEYPGWIHGKLFFNRTSFVAACREIELRFDVVVRIPEGDFGNENITGVLDAKTAGIALTSLCELAGKKFKQDGNAYTIY